MPRAVSDSSVLIHLGAIEHLDLLFQLFEEVLIPDAVWNEVVVQGRSPSVVEAIQKAARDGMLKVQGATDRALVQTLRQILHAGEAESICLALEERPDSLLMDESEGREVARGLGLTTKGIIGLLVRAKGAGLIPAVKPLLEELVGSGFYLAPSLIARVLEELSEVP
jgi:uncharacterized protein